MNKKTASERYGDEILTDNAALNHYSQCRDCMFRDKRLVNGEEYGYDKSVCRIYGKASAERTNKAIPDFFPYTPIEPGDKPSGIYNNAADCAYYEQEK